MFSEFWSACIFRRTYKIYFIIIGKYILVVTVSVKVWSALGKTVLLAVIVIGYVPPVPAPGVPLSVAVPLPLSTNVTPPGRAPVSLRAGAGEPVLVTVNVPALPTVKIVLAPLVMAGP